MKLPTALPMLTGRGLRLYRLVWFAMLGLALIGITAGAWVYFETRASWDRSFYGAGLRVTLSGGETTVSPIGSQAVGSGFVPGSWLVAINGRPVPAGGDDTSMNALARALEGPDGTELRLTIRTPRGAEAEYRVVRGPHHLAEADRSAPMSYRARTTMYVSLLVFTTLAMLLASILLFRRRASDPVVALLSIGLLTLLSSFAAHLVPDFRIAETVARWLGALGIATLLLGMTVFPSGRFEPRWSLLVLPLLGVIVTRPLWPDRLELLPRAAFVCSMLLLLAAIGRRYRVLAPGAQRQQIKWAVLGFAGFVLLGLCGLGLALIDEGVTDNRLHFALLILGTLAQASSYLLLVLGLMVSLLRYRLYDADAAISRSAAYASLTLTLVAVFAGTEKLAEALGQQYFGDSAGAASGAVAAGLAALLLVPLHNRLTRWAERRFQGDLVRLRRDLPTLANDLRDTASLSELSEAMLDALSVAVRASRSAALVDNEVQAVRDVSPDEVSDWLGRAPPNAAVDELDCDRADPLFPMRVPLRISQDAAPIGWFLLGPRPDGSFYGNDEREALADIARPLARAVQIVRVKEEHHRSQKNALAKLSRELADLRQEMLQRFAPASASAAE
jgi:hypothetical protein